MVTWKGMTAEQMTPSGKLNCVFQKVFFSAISFFNFKNVHVYFKYIDGGNLIFLIFYLLLK